LILKNVTKSIQLLLEARAIHLPPHHAHIHGTVSRAAIIWKR
jgi:hypothetical protein